MGLPPLKIFYVDSNNQVRTNVAVKTTQTAPKPTADYHPTMKIVQCAGCKAVGIAEFLNGFNIQDGDRLMDGKPIKGICLRCQKETDLVPIQVTEAQKKELGMLYKVQQSLDEAARRGERVRESGIVWPLERIREYERYQREAGLRASQAAHPSQPGTR